MVTSEAALAQSQEAPDTPQLVLPHRREARFWRFLSQLWFKRALFLGGDALAISLAHRLAESLTQRWAEVSPHPSRYNVFYILLFVVVLYFFGGYRDPASRRPEKELELGLKGVSFFFLALASANVLVFKPQSLSPYFMSCWCGISMPLLLASRFGLRGLYQVLWRQGLARETTLLAGSAESLEAFQLQRSVQRHFRHEIVGALVDRGSVALLGARHAAVPILGTLEDWETIVQREGVRWMILSVSVDRLGKCSKVLEVARRCHEKGIGVEVHSEALASPEFHYARDEFFGSFRFCPSPRWACFAQVAIKRILDLFLGLVGSAITLVLTPLIALLLRWESPGPVFYHSEFVGRDGRSGYYRKFRTMVPDADAILQNDPHLKMEFDRKYKLERDPRVLRVGRFLRKYSIDEFPQFFSLLSGKLTFVGPRTVRQEEARRYGDSLPRLLSVKPGMTGYWQVMGRQTTSYEERIRMDMFYVEHWSIWLDLVIIGRTFWKVLSGDGAY